MASSQGKTINVDIDGIVQEIPVSSAVYAHWNEQFVRPHPSPAQKKRYHTLMQVIRAAYKKGKG